MTRLSPSSSTDKVGAGSVRDEQDEPALGVANELFRLLVDAVDEYAIFMLDPSGVVRTWNSGARRIKGFDDAEIVGQHYSILFLPDEVTAGKPDRLLDDAVATGRAVDEGWRVRKDGSQFWANVVITALFDDDGRLRGFAKITRDDTARRAADEQARQLDLLLDHERIARDLNDAVITRIFGAGLALEGLRNLSDDPQLIEHIDQAIDELDHAIKDLRTIVLAF